MKIPARGVLPGMAVTLLLSAHVCAPAYAASAEHDGKAAHGAASTSAVAAGRKSTRTVRPSVKAADAKVALTHAPAAAHPKMRVVTPALLQGGNGRVVRRASLRGTSGTLDRTLIDDGTLWRERGGVATWQQTGMASWYGGTRWQGHRTSSGSRYDQDELTAAHATLPLGTKVRVVRHDGQRSVIVTINDRPGTRTRIIDLSRAAARELGILDSGVAMVTLQPM